MKAVVDTNVLIDGGVDLSDFQVAVSCLSWAELDAGVAMASTPRERATRRQRLVRLRALLGEGLPFDDVAAQAYGAVCELVIAQGRSVRGRVIDLMIAATAVAHGAVLVTRNVNDFAGLEELLTVVCPEQESS